MARFPTRKLFREWLAKHAPDESVGRAGDGNCCPLATYLGDAYDDHAEVMPDPCLSRAHWRVGDKGRGKPLPKWANVFAGGIDADGSFEISAATALSILDWYRS